MTTITNMIKNDGYERKNQGEQSSQDVLPKSNKNPTFLPHRQKFGIESHEKNENILDPRDASELFRELLKLASKAGILLIILMTLISSYAIYEITQASASSELKEDFKVWIREVSEDCFFLADLGDSYLDQGLIVDGLIKLAQASSFRLFNNSEECTRILSEYMTETGTESFTIEANQYSIGRDVITRIQSRGLSNELRTQLGIPQNETLASISEIDLTARRAQIVEYLDLISILNDITDEEVVLIVRLNGFGGEEEPARMNGIDIDSPDGNAIGSYGTRIENPAGIFLSIDREGELHIAEGGNQELRDAWQGVQINFPIDINQDYFDNWIPAGLKKASITRMNAINSGITPNQMLRPFQLIGMNSEGRLIEIRISPLLLTNYQLSSEILKKMVADQDIVVLGAVDPDLNNILYSPYDLLPNSLSPDIIPLILSNRDAIITGELSYLQAVRANVDTQFFGHYLLITDEGGSDLPLQTSSTSYSFSVGSAYELTYQRRVFSFPPLEIVDQSSFSDDESSSPAEISNSELMNKIFEKFQLGNPLNGSYFFQALYPSDTGQIPEHPDQVVVSIFQADSSTNTLATIAKMSFDATDLLLSIETFSDFGSSAYVIRQTHLLQSDHELLDLFDTLMPDARIRDRASAMVDADIITYSPNSFSSDEINQLLADSGSDAHTSLAKLIENINHLFSLSLNPEADYTLTVTDDQNHPVTGFYPYYRIDFQLSSESGKTDLFSLSFLITEVAGTINDLNPGDIVMEVEGNVQVVEYEYSDQDARTSLHNIQNFFYLLLRSSQDSIANR